MILPRVPDHRFFEFVAPPSGRPLLREVAVALMDFYSKRKLSRGKWLKQPPQATNWTLEKRGPGGTVTTIPRTSSAYTLRAFEQHLESGRFNASAFGLFDPQCDWLDASFGIALDTHFVDQNGDSLKIQAQLPFGDEFPLMPRIDREGRLFTLFQTPLQARILALRNRLVENSHAFQSDDWFEDLRSFVSECVSLIDVTVHQAYFKAKYAPLPWWKFDEARLGPRQGRKMSDKLGWIFQITGNHLQAEQETAQFMEVKGLRNHLHHFDPPCFAFTLEDVARWLNMMQGVASLAWKIRKALRSPLSAPLIAILLAPDVRFVPKDASRRRLDQPADVGYGSSKWKVAARCTPKWT